MKTDASAEAGTAEEPGAAAGGQIRVWHLLVLLVLLASPGLALWRLAPMVNSPLLVILWVLVSVTTYGLYALDKARARDAELRVPEAILHFAELIGGWPGAFLAQRRLRHKSRKISYQLVFWLIVAAHVYVATDYQLGWRLAREGWHAVRPAAAQAPKP